MTAVDAAWLENPSSGARRKMRRPIVCTIRHPSERRSDRQCEAAGEHHPERHGECLQAAARDEERADDAHRLLRVVRPEAEGEPGRHRPLRPVDRTPDPERRATQRPPAEADRRDAEGQAENGRDGQGDQDAEGADRLPPVEPAPADRVEPARRERRADEPADERVPQLDGGLATR